MIVAVTLCSYAGISYKKEDTKIVQPKISDKQAHDIRELAWNYIPKDEMPHIVGSWKDATIIKRQLEHFNKKEVYIVSFPTNENSTIGVYVIYMDINTKRYLGIGIRD